MGSALKGENLLLDVISRCLKTHVKLINDCCCMMEKIKYSISKS